jgi:thiamine kinase-like enzyme
MQWLGNWWQNRNSDYLSHNVAKYSLDYCAKFVTDQIILDVLSKTLNKRSKIWDQYNRYKFNTLIHWDLNPSNVLVKADQTINPNFKVIDWQTASIGIPQWDLVQLLIPLSNKFTYQEIEEFIDLYCEKFRSHLPSAAQSFFDKQQFKSLFNIVVVDHSFRSTINVLLSNEAADSEWEKCLGWINHSKGDIKDFLANL